MVILGVDPGTAVTGYGVILLDEKGVSAIDFGVVRPPSKLPLPDRYYLIFSALNDLIERFDPAVVAVETQFVQKNAGSALKLGMARAAVLIAAKAAEKEVVEVSPTTAKKAVTGSGRASKEGVQRMLQTLLHLDTIPTPEDAADALAIAFAAKNRTQQGKLIHV